MSSSTRVLNPGYPCPLCQVRPDVPCRHRPADPEWSMGDDPPDPDQRRGTPRPGQGKNFYGRRQVNKEILRSRKKLNNTST